MNIKRSVRSDININVETNEGNKMGHGRGSKDKPCDLKDSQTTPENAMMSPDKQAACDLIKQAIDKLSEVAETDEIARDSIANLGVVLLDLKG